MLSPPAALAACTALHRTAQRSARRPGRYRGYAPGRCGALFSPSSMPVTTRA